MFKIRWRNRSNSLTIKDSISRFSKEQAENQIKIWSLVFPFNSYYIEPA